MKIYFGFTVAGDRSAVMVARKIAEVSASSFGVGFETGYLLGATTKKVVLFYGRDAESKISLLITGIAHPNCTLAPYSDLNEVEIWIRNNLSQLEALPINNQLGS